MVGASLQTYIMKSGVCACMCVHVFTNGSLPLSNCPSVCLLFCGLTHLLCNFLLSSSISSVSGRETAVTTTHWVHLCQFSFTWH